MIKVVIAEDHKEVRNAWMVFLGGFAEIQIVRVCEDGFDVVGQIESLQPDIVLMDINMKRLNGIDATSVISTYWPKVKVIGVSVHKSPSYLRKMLGAGAKGYVTKSAVAEELLLAIHEVHNGNTYICREMREKQLDN